MELHLTRKQYRRLLDMVYIGNWVLNSTRGDDRIPDYDEVESLLFSKAKEEGMGVLAELYNGEVIPPDSDNFVSNENLFRYQAKVMLGLAQNESCVMIGRCADFILRDRPNVLRVFIHAPEEVRVRRVMQRHNLSEAEARRHMRQVDKRRADYYRAFTGSDWRDAGHYDICFDSDHMGEEKIIRFIMGYMNVCFED